MLVKKLVERSVTVACNLKGEPSESFTRTMICPCAPALATVGACAGAIPGHRRILKKQNRNRMIDEKQRLRHPIAVPIFRTIPEASTLCLRNASVNHWRAHEGFSSVLDRKSVV